MEPILIISAINAMMAAIRVWQKERDYKRTLEEYNRIYQSSQESSEVLAEAKLIVQLVPKETLVLLGKRVQHCWDQFNKEIDPSQINLSRLRSFMKARNTRDAEVRLEQCICEELRTIKRLNGTVPPGKLREWWNHYSCGPYIA